MSVRSLYTVSFRPASFRRRNALLNVIGALTVSLASVRGFVAVIDHLLTVSFLIWRVLGWRKGSASGAFVQIF